MRIPPDNERCMHTTSDGKRCRHRRLSGESLCGPHWNRAHERDNPMTMIIDLVRPDDQLDTARGVNAVLARVLKALTCNQIPTRTASTIAYICQLLLLSLAYLHKEADRQAVAESEHPILGADPESILAGLAETLQRSIAAGRQETVSHCPET